QFGKIKVLGVAETLKKESIHDLREGLVATTYASVSGNIENNCVCWNLFVDGFKQNLQLIIAGAYGKAITGGYIRDKPILDRKAKHFRETGFTRPEESRYPNSNALVRLIGRLSIRVKDIGVMRSNRVRNDVLIDLVT